MKTLLVTGASSGVGWALAVRAARAGYAVYAVGRNTAALAALRAKIETEFGIVAVEAGDIADPANAAGIVGRALGQFGSIDVLVNNAGFVSAGPLADQPDAELVRQFGTHVIGPVALVREALTALRAARGAVFMVGSGVARIPIGGLGAYPPAKAAIRSATAILRRELAPQGIAVTYVDPGAIDTPFMKRAGMPGAPAALLVSPEMVARKILIAVAGRPRELNVVGWQAAIVALADRFPRLTDALLERAPGLVGGTMPVADEPDPVAVAVPEPVAVAEAADPVASHAATQRLSEPESAPPDPFETALEPHRRRMEKLNFRPGFVHDLLVPGARLDSGEVALRWAGMPNKNERSITDDVLAALADAGFLAREDDGFRVIRAPGISG